MNCEHCQSNPAKVHVTQIKNNKKKVIHLCTGCAQKQSPGSISKNDLSQFIQNVLHTDLQDEAAAAVVQDDLECESCKLSYIEFKESGKFGCPDCYVDFEERLIPLIGKIQKSNRHIGKQPMFMSEPTIEENLVSLRKELKKAIESESYENAAKLRDEIRDLENFE